MILDRLDGLRRSVVGGECEGCVRRLGIADASGDAIVRAVFDARKPVAAVGIVAAGASAGDVVSVPAIGRPEVAHETRMLSVRSRRLEPPIITLFPPVSREPRARFSTDAT